MAHLLFHATRALSRTLGVKHVSNNYKKSSLPGLQFPSLLKNKKKQLILNVALAPPQAEFGILPSCLWTHS